MPRTASNLSHAHASQGVDIGRLILIGRVSQSQLSVFSSTPRKDSQAIGMIRAYLFCTAVAIAVVVIIAIVVAHFAQGTSGGGRFGRSFRICRALSRHDLYRKRCAYTTSYRTIYCNLET
jgi:hypothetical protein